MQLLYLPVLNSESNLFNPRSGWRAKSAIYPQESREFHSAENQLLIVAGIVLNPVSEPPPKELRTIPSTLAREKLRYKPHNSSKLPDFLERNAFSGPRIRWLIRFAY